VISLAQQLKIQVEVTNACPHRCASCTRFCGHHMRPYMVELPHFRNALDSLSGYPHMVGVMGGEPTLHPQFDEICRIIAQERPESRPMPEPRRRAIADFAQYCNAHLGDLNWRRGLWTSLGRAYYRHYEVIQETFGYQCINDHKHGGEHICLTLPRKELGVTDREWFELRDNCWLQREWSASITPHGAYFCEVAGSIDLLFNGGKLAWKVEKDWWMRTPREFGEQLQLCEMCSACLPVPRLRANSETDMATPGMIERLQAVASPKLKAGKVMPYNTALHQGHRFKVNQISEVYITDNRQRVAPTNESIKPQRVECLVVCLNYDDYLARTLPWNKPELGRMVVATGEEDRRTRRLCRELGVECYLAPRIHEDGAPFAKGKSINDALRWMKPKDWVLLIDADILLPRGWRGALRAHVLNPGVLYYTRRFGPKDPGQAQQFFDGLRRDMSFTRAAKENPQTDPYGYFQLFHLNAAALRGRSAIYPEKSGTAEFDDMEFGVEVYPPERISALPSPLFDVAHLPHGGWMENWAGRKSPRIDRPLEHGGLMQLRCVRKCFAQGRIYKPGETLRGNYSTVPMTHFERV
jgi:hypothetical protein